MTENELPIPPCFDPDQVGKIWKVDYQVRAVEAGVWAKEHGIPPASTDELRVCLLAVDVQNTFCTPGFELFVAGRSGNAAVEDSIRLCEFTYRNLGRITRIIPTIDSHRAIQIFHPIFLVDEQGRHPEPYTVVSLDDVLEGRWRVNPAVCPGLGVDEEYAGDYLVNYVRKLREKEKYDLTIWPYHGMLGSIGHALVPAVEEAFFFHTVARAVQPDFQVKGDNPLTEHYSVLGPEVVNDPEGKPVVREREGLSARLRQYDVIIIAGQAKSHCVAWTIEDLLAGMESEDSSLARKVYLMEDCTSPVVVPGVVDFTGMADEAFQRFSDAGMNVVRSTDPMGTWPGIGN